MDYWYDVKFIIDGHKRSKNGVHQFFTYLISKDNYS